MLHVNGKAKFESESHWNAAVARSDARPSDMRSWVCSSRPAALEISLHHVGRILYLLRQNLKSGGIFQFTCFSLPNNSDF